MPFAVMQQDHNEPVSKVDEFESVKVAALLRDELIAKGCGTYWVEHIPKRKPQFPSETTR